VWGLRRQRRGRLRTTTTTSNHFGCPFVKGDFSFPFITPTCFSIVYSPQKPDREIYIFRGSGACTDKSTYTHFIPCYTIYTHTFFHLSFSVYVPPNLYPLPLSTQREREFEKVISIKCYRACNCCFNIHRKMNV